MQNTPTPTPTPTPATCPPSSTGTNSVTFTVSLNQQQDGWHMVCNGTDYGPPGYPEISVPKDSVGVFNFSITSGANFPLNGPGNKINAVGIVGGNAKPPQAGNGSGLITVSPPTATTLSFTDSNNAKAANKLNYVLYFTDKSQLDPIIDNGGCCGAPRGGFFQSQAFVIALVVFAVLVVAYVGYRLFRSKPTGP